MMKAKATQYDPEKGIYVEDPSISPDWINPNLVYKKNEPGI